MPCDVVCVCLFFAVHEEGGGGSSASCIRPPLVRDRVPMGKRASFRGDWVNYGGRGGGGLHFRPRGGGGNGFATEFIKAGGGGSDHAQKSYRDVGATTIHPTEGACVRLSQ